MNLMTDLQCAKLLLKLLEEHKSKFICGLCGFIKTLQVTSILKEEKTYQFLLDFIIKHNPEVFPTKLRYSRELKLSPDRFYFKIEDIKKRKQWLQEIIKYYENANK